MIDFKALTFFDRASVVGAIDDRTRKALRRLGSFIWRRAKQSMRTRKGPSPVGSPPSTHKGKGQLKNLLFFQWDKSTQTVVCGPIPFARGTAPSANELGGFSVVRLPNGRVVRGVYKPRPFMAPAMKAELPRLGECFAAAGA